jgi:hypothetical protein
VRNKFFLFRESYEIHKHILGIFTAFYVFLQSRQKKCQNTTSEAMNVFHNILSSTLVILALNIVACELLNTSLCNQRINDELIKPCHLHLGLKWFLLFRFTGQNFVCIFQLSHEYHISHSNHCPYLHSKILRK